MVSPSFPRKLGNYNPKLWRSQREGGVWARGPGTPHRKGKKEINVTTAEVIQELCGKKRKLDFIL